MRGWGSLSCPHMLCVGLWGSVNMAVGVASCGGCRGKLLSSRPLCALLLLVTPPCLTIFSITPCHLFLCPVYVIFTDSSWCFSISAVNSVASLAVGTMQRQRERDSAVPKLTWTDGRRPPRRQTVPIGRDRPSAPCSPRCSWIGWSPDDACWLVVAV